MRNIWTLARMTYREALRRRIVLTALALGLCFLVVFSIGFHFIYGEFYISQDRTIYRIIRTEATNSLLLAGLYAVSFLSLAMGVLLGVDTLAGEIASGAIQTIASKPVRRAEIVLGKWLGFAVLLALYSMLMSGGTALSVFIQSGYVAPNLLVGIALIYLESLLMMTVSLAFSSAIPALAAGGMVFGLYGLAFIGGWIEQIGALLENRTAVKIGIVTSLIVPSEAVWRRAAFEMQSPLVGGLGVSPFGGASVPSAAMILYTIVYLVMALGVAIHSFQKRDI
ncbi:MAG: ABC transporter permease [Chloroflexota bacterium]